MGVAHRRAYIAHKDFSLYYKQEREMRGGGNSAVNACYDREDLDFSTRVLILFAWRFRTNSVRVFQFTISGP